MLIMLTTRHSKNILKHKYKYKNIHKQKERANVSTCTPSEIVVTYLILYILGINIRNNLT